MQDDLISRQAVLDLIEHYNSDGLGALFYGYDEGLKFTNAVNKLPSVNPYPQSEVIMANGTYYNARELSSVNPQPCDDAISKQSVLNACEQSINILEAVDRIMDLSPVNPQEPKKTGHWIEVTNGRGGHECSLCHEYAPSYQGGDEWLTKYCPNCGARMVEPQEERGKE